VRANLRWCALFLLALSPFVAAKDKKNNLASPSSREQFIAKERGAELAVTKSPGSLWPLEGGPLSDLASDYKANRLNDVVIIRISEAILAQASGTVDGERSFSTTSSITGVLGKTPARTNPLYGLSSANTLKGTGTANSQSLLQSNLSGRVVAVLPNGNFVVEAERTVTFNQQNQTIVLRGVVRPRDIGADNSVPSTSVSDLELELKGKGIVTDSTRQPNLFTRLLMKIANF
jgi:flagellar L-ring protein FlgH